MLLPVPQLAGSLALYLCVSRVFHDSKLVRELMMQCTAPDKREQPEQLGRETSS